jgi:hypothetical protein
MREDALITAGVNALGRVPGASNAPLGQGAPMVVIEHNEREVASRLRAAGARAPMVLGSRVPKSANAAA